MIKEKLYDWQCEIVNRLREKESFGLFLDMGLGKTPTSLALAESHSCDKILVVTINSKAIEDQRVPGSWAAWGSSVNLINDIRNKMQARKYGGDCDMLIVNYEGLFERNGSGRSGVKLRTEINDFINGCHGSNVALIIDESHKMKNAESIQTKSIIQIRKKIKLICKRHYVYLLTGTPFTTGFIDLYTQLKFLGCPLAKYEFIDKFCVRGNIRGLLGWQQPIVKYKNVKELYELVHQYAITIKSKDVVKLPEQIFVEHRLEPSKSFRLMTHEKLPVKEINDELIRRGEPPTPGGRGTKVVNPFYRNIAYPSLDWMADTSGNFWQRCRQISIGFNGNAEASCWYDSRRIKEIKKFLSDHEDNYVLFYNYTPELLALYDVCEELGYNIDVYCGEVKSLIYYQKFCEATAEEKLTLKRNIILANFASGSTGMNWQEYSQVIMFSVPLYSHYEQGIKRVHRIGQDETVVYHMFYQDNFLDRSMLKSLTERTEYTEEMFKENLLKELMKDE